MPVDRQVQLRYEVLNRCFRNRYKEYTIDDLVEECNKALLEEYDITRGVSKRTVQNDINNLQMSPYRIVLDETLKRGRQRIYRYVDTNYSIPQFRMKDSERNRIQSAIRVLEKFQGEPIYDWARSILMQIEAGAFRGKATPIVSFQTNPDLIGITHFAELLRAIIYKRVLQLKYAPFGKKPSVATIYPYHLKQYNDRWYLIAQVKGYDNYAHYALDRIIGFKEVALPYKEADADFEEYFDDVIGVTVPKEAAEDIIIKVYKPRLNYILTKPLHLSQRIVEEHDDYALIKINVKINKELESVLLSFGPDLEVVAPAPFRTYISKKIQALSDHYTNCEENLHSNLRTLQHQTPKSQQP